jgi:hypothetical protein
VDFPQKELSTPMTVFCDLKIKTLAPTLEKGIPDSFIATTTNKVFDLQALDFTHAHSCKTSGTKTLETRTKALCTHCLTSQPASQPASQIGPKKDSCKAASFLAPAS